MSQAKSRAVWLCLVLLTACFCAAPSNAAVTTFFDDFNRPDGVVGNGWTDASFNASGNLRIVGGKLTTPDITGSRANLYRPFDASAGATVSATLTETNGNNGPRRYESALYVGSNGTYLSGYALFVLRSDQGFNNSAVGLYANGVLIGTRNSSFQFGSLINVSVAFDVDGMVHGTVSGDGNTFTFSFGTGSVNMAALPGPYIGIELEYGNCCLRPTLDDFRIERNPATVRAYVTNAGSNSLSVIDPSTNTVASIVPVGLNPVNVAVTRDGSRAYVTNAGAHSVSVVDTSTNTVIATVQVGSSPVSVAITPDGARVYVANAASNNVSVIGTATNTVIATISVGRNPSGVAAKPDGSAVYVVNTGSNTVSVISTVTDGVVATISVGTLPSKLLIQ